MGASRAATITLWSPTALDHGGRPGGDVVVPITISPADGVSTMELEFTYDPSVVRVTGAYLAPLAHGHALDADLASPGVVRLALDGPAIAGSGEVAWLRFHVAAGTGATDLGWVSAVLNGGTIPATLKNGRIPVIAAPAVVSVLDDAKGPPGAFLAIPVRIEPVNGASAIDLRLRFDPYVFSVTHVAPTPISAGATLTWNQPTPGDLLVSLYQTQPMSGSGPIVLVEGNLVGAVGSATPIDLRRGDLDEQSIPSVLDDGLVGVCDDVDRDGDQVASCDGDCDDADPGVFPGAGEICNGRDDDCDGAIDEAVPAPGPVSGLRVRRVSGAVEVSWSPVAEATSYDVVRGSLTLLRAGDGDYAGSTDACPGNDLSVPSVEDPDAPISAWYLARASSCGGAGTYGSGRDAGIAGSTAACP